jgi:hypothetical protein
MDLSGSQIIFTIRHRANRGWVGSAVPLNKKQAAKPASLPLKLRFVFYTDFVSRSLNPRLHARGPLSDYL